MGLPASYPGDAADDEVEEFLGSGADGMLCRQKREKKVILASEHFVHEDKTRQNQNKASGGSPL